MNTLSPRSVATLCGSLVLALAVWMISRPEPEPYRAAPSASARQLMTAAAPAPPADDQARVEYVSQMPTGAGVTVVAGNGQYVGDAVLLAVPDDFGAIKYLPRNDPRAVHYAEAQQLEHERVTLDAGPKEVNLGSITVKNSVTARRRGVPINRKP